MQSKSKGGREKIRKSVKDSTTRKRRKEKICKEPSL